MNDPEPRETGLAWAAGAFDAVPLPGGEDDLLKAIMQLTSTLDVDGVCDAVLRGESVFKAASSWIMLHDPGDNMLRTRMFRGRREAVTADAIRIEPAVARVQNAGAGAPARAPGGAAALLGLKPTTLHAKMKKLGVRRADALDRQVVHHR